MLTLSACKIDLSIVGDGVVKTESSTFDCSTGTSGDCEQYYVTDVTQCPNYAAPTGGALPTIPANCTVLVATNTDCPTTFLNGVIWQNCIPDDNGMGETFHALAGEGSVFSNWGGDNFGCNGQITTACNRWISPDDANTDAEIAITANFAEETTPQDAQYTYNHLGQRKSKTVGGVTTYFVYSDIDGQLLGEYTSTGAPIREYIYLQGERVAMFNWDNSTTPPTKHIIYFANNQVGQTVAAWDSTGQPVYERVQTPFGETMGEWSAGVEITSGLLGQYRDKESGLHYNEQRYFDPSTGAFPTPDPIGQRGGINIYQYALSNPVMFVDPNGLEVAITITNTAKTANSITGTISVTSDSVADSFHGVQIQDSKAGSCECKNPLADGTYSAFVRPDRKNRIELIGTASQGLTNIQIHTANAPTVNGKEILQGCIGPGTSSGGKPDWVENSAGAMQSIMDVVKADGSNRIIVNVKTVP